MKPRQKKQPLISAVPAVVVPATTNNISGPSKEDLAIISTPPSKKPKKDCPKSGHQKKKPSIIDMLKTEISLKEKHQGDPLKKCALGTLLSIVHTGINKCISFQAILDNYNNSIAGLKFLLQSV